MAMLKEYYNSKIENLRFVEFLKELDDFSINLDKEIKIKVYKMWIMGYSRKQIREKLKNEL